MSNDTLWTEGTLDDLRQEFGDVYEGRTVLVTGADGFLAAYALFAVIVIAAQAIRLTVLPQLARAREEQRLAGELAGFALAISVFAVPLLLATAEGTTQRRASAAASCAASDPPPVSTSARMFVPTAAASRSGTAKTEIASASPASSPASRCSSRARAS